MTIERLAGFTVLIASGIALWDSLRAAPPPPRPLMPRGRDVGEFIAELKAILEAEKALGIPRPLASDPFAIPCDCGPPTPVPPALPLAYIEEQVGPFVVRRPVCLAPTCFAPPRPGSMWCLIHGLDRPHDPEHVALSTLAAPNN